MIETRVRLPKIHLAGGPNRSFSIAKAHKVSNVHTAGRKEANLGVFCTFVHLSTLDDSVKLETAVLIDGGEGVNPSLANEPRGFNSWGQQRSGLGEQLGFRESGHLLVGRYVHAAVRPGHLV